MISWLSLALAALKFANFLLARAHEREFISEGYDKAIFEETKRTLVITTQGKALMEKVSALPDRDVDALADAIGGASGGGKN